MIFNVNKKANRLNKKLAMLLTEQETMTEPKNINSGFFSPPFLSFFGKI